MLSASPVFDKVKCPLWERSITINRLTLMTLRCLPHCHVILIYSWQTLAACDQCHHGSGPAAGHPGEVCAGGSAAERGQGEGRQTLDVTTFPPGPRHLRVDLQAHGVWTHSHQANKMQQMAHTVFLKGGKKWHENYDMFRLKLHCNHRLIFCPVFGSMHPWDPERCLVQFEKDGVIQTHEKSQRQHNGLSYSHSWASQQKVSQTNRKPPI